VMHMPRADTWQKISHVLSNMLSTSTKYWNLEFVKAEH
jgi:hypothetical protein